MQLYLMQHGLAFSQQESPERPLSPEGVTQVRNSAAGIRQLQLRFDLIAASPKRRAKQTAALIAEAVRYPHSDILITEALLPKADPEAILAILDHEAPDSRVLLVGHQPLLGALTCHLLGSATITYEQAGLCLLERPEVAAPATLGFLLTANHLSRLAAASTTGK